jgi:hypothetical protein
VFIHAINPRIQGQFSSMPAGRAVGRGPFGPLTEEVHVRCTDLTRVWIICLAVILIYSSAYAQKKSGAPERKETKAAEQAEKFFDMKVSEGFAPAAVDEPGILKWKKDSGEIYLVVGDLFAGAPDTLFKALHEAADKDKNLEEVKVVKIKGGKAMLYKEKAPEDPGRIRAWHLVVITKKKMINVDFSAPAKDFDSFIPAFESAVRSFKLKSSS